ncbi:Integrase [Methylomagnum ishizawai]|uniref:Integrase n=1 Tax=Methylomagnum ishizawai TaxID=1760988 RepID=A0A1Y6CUW5_9GAMM|nr:site-specific integrase [Methylomagnum ishizawai]SMF94000.1 Integrase [Methylomagnum ishizawai]
MGKLTDVEIRNWIKAGERFDMRSIGDGLYLRYREADAVPLWRFRYRIGGKQRVMNLGGYGDLSLADARKTAKELRARVALGHDVAAEKQERKAEAVAKMEAGKNALTVAKLSDEYFERMILGRWKHPNIVRSRIEKDIKPSIGKLKVEDVKPSHIDAMLQTIVKRGAPTIANDVLRWARRIFDYGIKRHMLQYNPASAFDLSDAGGREEARERALSGDELVLLFQAMRDAKGFSYENLLAVKLLLLLAVRKGELVGARWAEFNLDQAVWCLPAERTKTEAAIDIPLPVPAVDALRELHRLACGSEWVFPARKVQHRMIPHIHENTLNVALSKVKPLMPGVEPFCVHDFRRTARTHLAALGVDPHIAERCLNHKIKGVEGIYNRHDYFEERRKALELWAKYLESCEKGEGWNVVPFRRSMG